MFVQYFLVLLLLVTSNLLVVYSQEDDEVMEAYASKLLFNLIQNNTRNHPEIRPKFGNGSLPVNISIFINDINSISQHSMDFTVNFDIQTFWKDHRLNFSIEHNISELILDERNLKYIWLPDTFSPNSVSTVVHKTFTNKNTVYTRITSTGEITYETTISLKAECSMDLANFPFDRCSYIFLF